MYKHFLNKLLVLFLVFYIHNGHAAVLTVQMPNGGPAFSTSAGTVFDAKIMINTVSDFAGFDVTLIFDSTKLSALSITGGNIFGAADTELLVNSISPSSANYAEAISATSAATAGLNISVPTLLATVQFRALTAGANSLVDISNPILSDYSGNSIGGAKQGAFVTITPAAVPLPGTALLFAPALMAIFGFGKKQSSMAP